jgi:hypothetical protein
VVGGILILLIICFSAVWRFGSINGAIGALQGDELIIEAILLPGEEGPASAPVSIVAASLSGEELTLLGAESGCGCVTFEGLPAKIPPRGRSVIRAKSVPGKNRGVASRVVIYTTSRVNPRIAALVPP